MADPTRAFMTDPGGRRLPLIMALSGFTFLIYEVSWHRLLSLALGATVTASTIVLSVFMAGLGLGAWFWGRRVRGRTGLGRRLAGLALGVAVCGALTYPLMVRLLPRLYGPLGNGAGATLVVYLAAAGALLVPTFLMGGLFPLASQLAARAGSPVATLLGRLYAAETLGSALGGLLTGYVLLGALGQRATLLLAVVVNLALAAGWLTIREGVEEDGRHLADPIRSPRRGRADAEPSGRRRAALIGAAGCGLAMLALQVLWIRMFRIYLTNTSYTFALVASLVILGVFGGSTLYARRGERLDDPRGALIGAMTLLAGLALAGLWLLVRLPQTLMFPFEAHLASPLLRAQGIPLVASLLIVVPPAVCSGFALPLACRLAATSRDALGRDVGAVLLANTAGATLGPVLAAFGLLPLLGAATAVLATVALLLLAAALCVPTVAASPRRPALLVFAGLLVAVTAMRPEIRILPPSFLAFHREILDYRESVEGTLSVAKDPGPGGTKYTFVNNSAVIGSSYDAVKVVKMVGHAPFFLGLEAREVLVVGFGIGVTTSAIAAHPSVARIDCVELVPGLRDAAGLYRDLNHDIAHDPRLHLIGGDGRHFLQTTPNTYDLISCDPTHPILGSGSLYTADYFTLCRDHLNPGGMVSQYLPLHKLGDREFQGLIATFGSVFPHCTVWLGQFHAVLIGSLEPLRTDFADWSDRVTALGFDRHFYLEPHHLAATLVLDGEAVAGLVATRRLNTDDRSYTEFFRPACLDEDNLVGNLRWLEAQRVPLARVFDRVDDPALLQRFVTGNRLVTEALIARFAGELRQGRAKLEAAMAANPEDQELPFLMRLYFEGR
ncbi:MAG: fused MFS/spermidine synthase [Candidatus Krumholzibacteriia bacterium]